MQLAIAVHSSLNKELEDKIKRFFENLKCNPTVLVGGYWGGMKVVVDEAIKKKLKVVVILPEEREDVELPPDVIRINSGCEYRCRSVILVRSADLLVSLGGEVGTTIEIFMAYAMGKRALVLSDTGFSTDKLKTAFSEYLDNRKVMKVEYYSSPEDLAKEVCKPITQIKTNFG
jgi:Predicted Rossmann fold nucleotide-binding protein